MRGLAILLVVFYHNFGFIDYFFFGWLGVDLFFVLSGFLITTILLRTQGEKYFLRNFYIRRILRIFPLYYLVVIIVLFILPQIQKFPFNLSYYVNNQIWFWTYLQNWLFIVKPIGETNFIHHFWSLAVEEQFYIVWPLVILLLKKPKKILIFISALLVLILVVRSIIWVDKIDNIIYFSLYTFTRIDGICIGCIIALSQEIKPDLINRYQPFIVLLFAILNFIFYFINTYYNFTFPYLALIGYTTFAMLFGLLVREGVKQKNKLLSTFFTWKPLQFLGKISYGLYIFHWPVYSIVFPYLIAIGDHWFENILLLNIIASTICILISIGLSIISFYSFEQFFLKFKYKFK